MTERLAPRIVELWAVRHLENWKRGTSAEDARVELKKCMPESVGRVARRIAGHANAAQGEPILWILGADEKEKTLQPTPIAADSANFWPQVWARFEGPHPDVLELQFEFADVPLVALGFTCDRVPYVVTTGIDGPRYEVPWRQGTRIDSASRSQLLRMLLPAVQRPAVEVRRLSVDHTGIAVFFFVVPQTTAQVMLPLHAAILDRAGHSIEAYEVTGNNSLLVRPHPVVREVPGQGVYLDGPAEIVVKWRVGSSQPPQPCRARLRFEPGAMDVVVADGMPSR
jgi:hypothetical protein